MTPIVGSIVALVTPMHEDGSVDYDALKALIDWHIAEGTDCIGVVGTTGESPTVNVEEHCEIIRVSVEQAAKRVREGKSAGGRCYGYRVAGKTATAQKVDPKTGEAYDFSCVEWLDQGEGREPAMSGGAMSAECSVVSATDAGTHRLFIAAVTRLSTNDKRPLLYWNRLYGFPTHPNDERS